MIECCSLQYIPVPDQLGTQLSLLPYFLYYKLHIIDYCTFLNGFVLVSDYTFKLKYPIDLVCSSFMEQDVTLLLSFDAKIEHCFVSFLYRRDRKKCATTGMNLFLFQF